MDRRHHAATADTVLVVGEHQINHQVDDIARGEVPAGIS